MTNERIAELREGLKRFSVGASLDEFAALLDLAEEALLLKAQHEDDMALVRNRDRLLDEAHEQLRRSATVCPKDGCMLWRGHSEPHATAAEVRAALAIRETASTYGHQLGGSCHEEDGSGCDCVLSVPAKAAPAKAPRKP